MKTLMLALGFFLSGMIVSDHAGTWTFSIDTPDGNIKGEMILEYEDDEYTGKIVVYGTEYEMTSVEVSADKLSFSTNAAGYSSTIKGTISDDVYTATVYVEGMEIPFKAEKE